DREEKEDRGVHAGADGGRAAEADRAGVGELRRKREAERNRHPEHSEGSRRGDPSSSARLRMTAHERSFNFRNALPAYKTSATPPATKTTVSASAPVLRVA